MMFDPLSVFKLQRNICNHETELEMKKKTEFHFISRAGLHQFSVKLVNIFCLHLRQTPKTKRFFDTKMQLLSYQKSNYLDYGMLQTRKKLIKHIRSFAESVKNR